jgi:hypothetical protein
MWTERRLVDEATLALSRGNVDLVLSTHFMVSLAFALARKKLGVSTRLLTAIPDYGPAPGGFFPVGDTLRPDGYIVMDSSTQRSLATRLHPDSRLHLAGFLTRPCFAAQGAVRRRMARAPLPFRRGVHQALLAELPALRSLDLDKPTVAFLGGSAWAEKTWPVLSRVLQDKRLTARVNVLVLAGKTAAFEVSARHALETARARGAVFGFLPPEQLARVLSLVDVPVLGSLAPATMHELLELGVGPWLVFHTIPGAEAPHVPWMEEHGFGQYVPDARAMHARVREAVGLEPSGTLAALRLGFVERAHAMRREHQQRALLLTPFVRSVLALGQGAPAITPIPLGETG